jgi:hypothetical protein
MPDKLPVEVKKAVETYGFSRRLDYFLADWRKDIQDRNWLNTWVMNHQDRLFIDFHNDYLKQREG